MSNRDEIIHLLNQLPQVKTATHQEAFTFLGNHKLYGKGIGWIDAHLLGSCALTHVKLIIYDKLLQKIADEYLI